MTKQRSKDAELNKLLKTIERSCYSPKAIAQREAYSKLSINDDFKLTDAVIISGFKSLQKEEKTIYMNYVDNKIDKAKMIIDCRLKQYTDDKITELLKSVIEKYGDKFIKQNIDALLIMSKDIERMRKAYMAANDPRLSDHDVYTKYYLLH